MIMLPIKFKLYCLYRFCCTGGIVISSTPSSLLYYRLYLTSTLCFALTYTIYTVPQAQCPYVRMIGRLMSAKNTHTFPFGYAYI